jgi:hypothetical protein
MLTTWHPLSAKVGMVCSWTQASEVFVFYTPGLRIPNSHCIGIWLDTILTLDVTWKRNVVLFPGIIYELLYFLTSHCITRVIMAYIIPEVIHTS